MKFMVQVLFRVQRVQILILVAGSDRRSSYYLQAEVHAERRASAICNDHALIYIQYTNSG
jgi:hypothetical protein